MVEVMKKVSENYVENAKAARKMFPKAVVFDVTMDGAMKKLDPSFPLGKIEIPGMNKKGLSLRSVWEGLKVFEKKENIDELWMNDEKKLGKLRGCKSWGKLKGIKIKDEVIEREEGERIFEEIYENLIGERFGKMIAGIRKEAEKRPVVLLDYKEENERPFNHVEVLKKLIVA